MRRSLRSTAAAVLLVCVAYCGGGCYPFWVNFPRANLTGEPTGSLRTEVLQVLVELEYVEQNQTTFSMIESECSSTSFMLSTCDDCVVIDVTDCVAQLDGQTTTTVSLRCQPYRNCDRKELEPEMQRVSERLLERIPKLRLESASWIEE